jgi:hypothetical protein
MRRYTTTHVLSWYQVVIVEHGLPTKNVSTWKPTEEALCQGIYHMAKTLIASVKKASWYPLAACYFTITISFIARFILLIQNVVSINDLHVFNDSDVAWLHVLG